MSSARSVPSVRRRQSAVVRGFLRVLLGVVGATILLNGLILGRAALAPATLVPNLALAAVVGVALGLSRRDRYEAAAALVSGLFLASVAIAAFLGGPDSAGVAHVLLFVPIVLVGLVMGRRALYVTGSLALATTLLPSLLRQLGVLPLAPGAEVPWGTVLQYALVLGAVTFFLDRFGSALRDALQTSVARERELEAEVRERRRVEASLRDATRFTEVVAESIPGVFYVVDGEGRFVRWNDALLRLLDRDADELATLRVHDVVRGLSGDELDGAIDDALRGEEVTAEIAYVDRHGREKPYFATASRVVLEDAAYLAVIGLDTSDLAEARADIERLNRELRRRLDHITALRAIDRAITGSFDLDATLRVILEQVTGQLRADAAAVFLLDEEGEHLRKAGGRGFHRDVRPVLRVGEAQAGRVARTRERVVIDDPAEFDRVFGGVEALAAEGFRAYVAVPLVAQGRLHGVLEVFHRAPLELDEERLSFLEALAMQAAIALSSIALFDGLERSNEELRHAYDTTIEGWARALDLRDEETEGHSRRVTDTTVRLARAIGMDEDAIEHVRRGALLHDIGKMGIPDRILLKPGKLDAEEWEWMKQHPSLAYELLVPIRFLRPALDIPYGHHERWDGSGYPRGLKGEEIPLPARVFAVADVFDALTSDRPYREAWSRERALAHVRDGAGSHFDPAVVEAFLELMQPARSG